MHKKETKLCLSFGSVACFSASTFSGSGRKPSLFTNIPQKGTSGLLNRHLSRFSVIPDSSTAVSTACKTRSCSALSFVAIMTFSWMRCTSGMCWNRGQSALANSLDAGLLPIVRTQYRINLFCPRRILGDNVTSH